MRCVMWVATLALALFLQWNLDAVITTMKHKATSPLSSKWYKDKQRSLTKKQKQILCTYGSEYIIPLKYNETITLPADKNLNVEIGCGTGDFLVTLCKHDNDAHTIGCDIHR